LQNNPSEDREFELIYVDRDDAALRQLLKADLQELRDSPSAEDREIAEQFDRYKISVYGSLACRNTFYDALTRNAIGNAEGWRKKD